MVARARRRSSLFTGATGAAAAAIVVSACGIDLVGTATEDDPVIGPRGDAESDSSNADREPSPVDATTEESTTSDCPPACTDCAKDVCRIVCPGPACTDSTLACPDGMRCRVECTAKKACEKKTILCAPGRLCSVICEAEACDSADIQGSTALALCVECRDNGGAPGCNNLSCEIPGPERCQKVCSGDSCRGMSGCDDCRDFFFCP